MEIITPYYTIFKENNWFFNSETKNIGYSDEDITITSVILNIPFRDDVHYNKRLLRCPIGDLYLISSLMNFLTNSYL